MGCAVGGCWSPMPGGAPEGRAPIIGGDIWLSGIVIGRWPLPELPPTGTWSGGGAADCMRGFWSCALLSSGSCSSG
jgi:hypothetical protein